MGRGESHVPALGAGFFPERLCSVRQEIRNFEADSSCGAIGILPGGYPPGLFRLIDGPIVC
jgi:hypothetical protein